ncbi:MAG TPA: gliding motility-associated C-terminal domain-containing protein [Saprospiraceae bacterium]|nr:gliding motility-associated C-terminal domain-containing protein [Saprospiraceae bacterium]
MSICTCLTAFAQVSPAPLVACNSTCTGNLGENIFPDGDFGQGVANILPGNPGLAPGYSYVLNPPPNDGSYTITNNTSSWGFFAANTWIDIMDNGPEPNGYMMVVNASYQPGLFYEKTVTVCENTLYEFSIDVIAINEPQSGSYIQPNVAFQIDGNTVCETNNIPINKTWYTYRFSFTTAPGQTSATLSLRNNAPGGIGNDLAIDNISFRACGPEIALPAIAYFCENQPLTLNATLANSPYTTTFYQWQTKPSGAPNWVDVSGATGPTATVNDPVTGNEYRLVVANSAGNLSLPNCRAVSSAVEAALEDLSGFAITGEDTIVCNGAPAVLQAGNYADYQWSTGVNTDALQTDDPGWYAVTITTSNGCTATDSLYVFEVNLAATAEWADPLCFGDSTGTIEAGGIQGGVGPIRYAIDDGLFQSASFWNNLPSGNHVLTVADSLNCRFEIPFTLFDPPRFEVSLGDDRSILVCDSLTLSSMTNRPAVSYDWQPPLALSCSNCLQPVAMPSATTTYILTVVDATGCVAQDSVTITVLPRLDVYGPNVFVQDVANNDENNYFTLFTSKSATLVRRLMIYDRWGELVFSRQDRAPGDLDLRWDGSDFRGKALDEGVFVWVAEIEFTDGQSHIYSGDVTLLRR